MAFELHEIATPDGVAAILPLLGEAIETVYGPEADSRARLATARRFLLQSLAERETLLLAAGPPGPRGDAHSGLLAAARATNPFLGTAVPCLYLLYVRPAERRRGIAAALLARAESLFLARGFRSLAVEAPYQDDALISMGERRGYVREREWMVKDLRG